MNPVDRASVKRQHPRESSPSAGSDIPHLERIPGLGALAARRLAGSDLEILGRQTHGAFHAQLLALRAVDELSAHLLERRDLARGQGDADLVDLGRVALRGLLGVLVGHDGGL